MHDLALLGSYQGFRDFLFESGRSVSVLGRTLYDLEIYSVEVGGTKDPPIVITAGAHAGEPAGVLAALELVNSLETDHRVYIVPIRDPFAWGGYAECLARVLGRHISIDSHEDAERILFNEGTVLYEELENRLVISLVGDLVFVSMRPLPQTAGPRDIERRLNKVLGSRPGLVRVLSGRRACWPTNLPGIEGCGIFDRAFSAHITSHGVIADLNRQFTYGFPPVEVGCLRRLVDQVRPGLVLDLHEGQGSKFYLWTSPFNGDERRSECAQAILTAVTSRGGQLYRLSELAERIDPKIVERLTEPIPGLIIGPVHSARQGMSFEAYCQRYGAAFSFEPGRWKGLAERVNEVLAGADAAISTFGQQHTN